MENGWKWFVAFAAGGFMAGVAAIFVFLTEVNEGYFDPVYGPQGRYVYFIQRRTIGVTWGLGIEFVTGPAQAFAFSDRLGLNRLEVATGRIEELESWPGTPITRRLVRNYRGAMFQALSAQLRAEAPGRVEYRVAMTVSRLPQPETFSLGGVWSEGGPGRRGEWQAAPVDIGGGGVTPLHGDSELMTVPGRESYPAAIISYDHVRQTNTVLLANGQFDALYGNGVPLGVSRSQSRRASIERRHVLEGLRDGLVSGFEAMGQSAMEAARSAIGELRRRGYYPADETDATLTARRLEPGRALRPDAPPLFEIAEAEFEAGLFADIAAAIERPGQAARWRGDYASRREFDTGARLNAHLAAGNDTFRVGARGRVFELTLDRRPE